MFIRKFVMPVCASDDPAYEEFLSAFGVSQGTETQHSEETVEENVEDNNNDNNEEVKEESSQEEVPSEVPTERPVEAPTKSANAFAQMRVENKKYQNMIKDIASLLGVQGNDHEQIMSAMQDKIVNAQAKQQGIPTELAQRLAQLEARDREYTLGEIRRNAYLGFQQIKDTFGLDDASLNQFADTLIASGVNPFEQQVDLVSEYKLRNFDNLIKAAEERGAKAEAERASRASSQSTTPNAKQGMQEPEKGKITSIADLNKWLEDNK